MYADFYHGKRVLVTGIAGVKGTWLALALLRAGASVTGLDIKTPEPDSNFTASGLRERVTFVHGDVADLSLMESLVSDADCVFHLAARALVYDSLMNPWETYHSNTMGVVSVLEAIRRLARPIAAVFVTTDKVYQPKGGQPWVESDPLVASGPYAVSKACAEYIIADYHRAYFAGRSAILLGTARAGNVVIGGDLHSSRTTAGGGRIFVDCYEALAEARSPEIFSPAFTRPYTYGLDIISGYMALMARLDRPEVSGEAFNFGPQEEHGVSNADLATGICKLWGTGTSWHSGQLRDEPFALQSLSIRKSRELLLWRPAYTLQDALVDTTAWYRAWYSQPAPHAEGCMRELNDRLLEKFELAARTLGIVWAEGAGKAKV